MRHSFTPFGIDEVMFLSAATGIDYSRTDFTRPHWLCVAGYDDADRLMGLACFEFKTWFDAYFSLAVRDQRCITRRVMRAMFRAVFSQAVRVTAEVPPENELVLAKAQRMGFEIEGYKRLAIEGRRDAFLLGMTKDTCRFLDARQRARQPAANEVSDGQLAQSS